MQTLFQIHHLPGLYWEPKLNCSMLERRELPAELSSATSCEAPMHPLLWSSPPRCSERPRSKTWPLLLLQPIHSVPGTTPCRAVQRCAAGGELQLLSTASARQPQLGGWRAPSPLPALLSSHTSPCHPPPLQWRPWKPEPGAKSHLSLQPAWKQ